MSLFACPGSSSARKRLEPVHDLDASVGAGFAVGEHPERLKLAIGLQHAQPFGPHGDDRDRVRVQRVGLAVVAGVEQPDPGSEFGGDVDDVLASLKQPLGQRAAGTVGALDRPDPLRPGLRKGSHREVAGPVGGEPTRAE